MLNSAITALGFGVPQGFEQMVRSRGSTISLIFLADRGDLITVKLTSSWGMEDPEDLICFKSLDI